MNGGVHITAELHRGTGK